MSQVEGMTVTEPDRLADLEGRIQELETRLKTAEREDSVSIVVFSGEWDRLFAAFTIANGALALGQEVNMFFTFWGATAVRKKVEGSKKSSPDERNWMQKMLGAMLPSDLNAAPLSKLHFLGLGKWMMKIMMRQKKVDDLPVLMADARDLGVKFFYCDTSLSLFGWSPEDMIDGDCAEWCGVSTFLSKGLKGKIVLFI
jgi:peroxiredoxin family protein